MKRKYVIHPTEAETYSPPRHRNTLNYRLAGKGGLDTENVTIVLGELGKDSEAEYHLHENSEQAIFVLEGECALEFQDGVKETARQEDLVILPRGLGHRVVPTTETCRLLVIYSPKLGDGDVVPVED